MTDLIPADDDDLFEPAEADPIYGVNKALGRYVFPPPPGTPRAPRGYMRTTNLVSAFSDQERLQLWLEWKAMIGLRAGDGLLMDEWLAERLDHLPEADQRALANAFAQRAREAAGADEAARRGTAQHLVMHTYLSTGEITGTRSQRERMGLVLAELDALGYDLVPGDEEMTVWHPIAGGTVGTMDARVMCRYSGTAGVLDWKTQMRFWTFQEVGGQLADYDSAPWAWRGPKDDRGRWCPAPRNTLVGRGGGKWAGKRVALVAHMPIRREPGQPAVRLLEVSMDYGMDVLRCAGENVRLRSIGRAQALGRIPATPVPRGIDTPAIAG